jgi:hypothetical protein
MDGGARHPRALAWAAPAPGGRCQGQGKLERAFKLPPGAVACGLLKPALRAACCGRRKPSRGARAGSCWGAQAQTPPESAWALSARVPPPRPPTRAAVSLYLQAAMWLLRLLVFALVCTSSDDR